MAEINVGTATLPDTRCVCGGRIAPLLGRVSEGTRMDWSVWIIDNYEHIERPDYAHAPVAVKEGE